MFAIDYQAFIDFVKTKFTEWLKNKRAEDLTPSAIEEFCQAIAKAGFAIQSVTDTSLARNSNVDDLSRKVTDLGKKNGGYTEMFFVPYVVYDTLTEYGELPEGAGETPVVIPYSQGIKKVKIKISASRCLPDTGSTGTPHFQLSCDYFSKSGNKWVTNIKLDVSGEKFKYDGVNIELEDIGSPNVIDPYYSTRRNTDKYLFNGITPCVIIDVVGGYDTIAVFWDLSCEIEY